MGERRTPAMNNPNAIPNLPKFAKERLVSAGLLKLPGASAFVSPSMSKTNTTSTVEAMPSIEVYDNRDKGRNTEGIRLYAQLVSTPNSV